MAAERSVAKLHYHVTDAGRVVATYPWREAARRQAELIRFRARKRGEYLSARYVGYTACERAECAEVAP